jgi:hypothetical protein
MDLIKQRNLIRHLKTLTRHSASPVDPMDAVNFAVGTAAVLSLTDAYAELANEQSLTVRGISALVGAQEEVNKLLVAGTTATLALELRNKELNKSFGINSVSAANLGSKLQTIAAQIGSTGVAAQKYAISINKMLPTLNQVTAADSARYKGLLRVQDVLTTTLGLSAEQAEKQILYAGQSGKNVTEQLVSQHNLSKAIESSTGMLGSFKMISEGIAESSEDVQLQFGKMPGNLELAVLKAKSLGFTMNDLKNTANNLLNIESSVGDELEYQLLSGRRLVDNSGKSLTNTYREAALKGDGNKMANTLNTLLENEGKTLKDNLFARQQMSKLLGMDEAALSRALQKKSILESIPGGDALFDKTGDELMKAAEAMGYNSETLDQLRETEDTRTTDERMAESLEKLTDVMIKKFAPEQATLVKGAADAAMRSSKKAKFNMPDEIATPKLIGQAKQTQTIYNAGKDVITTGQAMTSADMNTAGATGEVKIGKDILSPPAGYGTRTLMGPEGAIQLNNKDTVIAGTNLFDKSSTDNSALEKAMLAVGNMIVNAINKQRNLDLSGYYS